MAPLRLGVTPIRYASNPIIPLGGSGSWYEKQVFDQTVMVDPANASNLIMFATGMKAPVETGEMSIGKFTSTVANPYSWTEIGQVLQKGAGGSYDSAHVRLGNVIYDGGTYYLYYTATTTTPTWSIGLATSTDGVTFTKHASNPILTATGQGRDDGGVTEPAVIKEGSDWTMTYVRGGLQNYRYATSSDGITWTKAGSGDMLTAKPAAQVEKQQIVKINGAYYLIYEAGGTLAASSVPSYRIFIAVGDSPRSTFTNIPNQPVLAESGVVSAFDRYHVATPYVVEINGVWRLFYVGAGVHQHPYNTNEWPMGIANFEQTAFSAGSCGRGGRGR